MASDLVNGGRGEVAAAEDSTTEEKVLQNSQSSPEMLVGSEAPILGLEEGGDENRKGEFIPGEKINASKNDDDSCKLFVGGLSWETSQKGLKDYFSQFGPVEDCTIKMDPLSGRSRGFGFVLFSEVSGVEKVFQSTEHKLDGRTIDPKPAMARGGQPPITKIFVGGINPECPEETLRDYFTKFGEVKDIELPIDRATNKRRGFCFIDFGSEEVVNEICKDQWHEVGGSKCEVKKATPKDQQQKMASSNTTAAAALTAALGATRSVRGPEVQLQSAYPTVLVQATSPTYGNFYSANQSALAAAAAAYNQAGYYHPGAAAAAGYTNPAMAATLSAAGYPTSAAPSAYGTTTATYATQPYGNLAAAVAASYNAATGTYGAQTATPTATPSASPYGGSAAVYNYAAAAAAAASASPYGAAASYQAQAAALGKAPSAAAGARKGHAVTFHPYAR